MLPIDVIVPSVSPRLWQHVLVERLKAIGHDVAVLTEPERAQWPLAMSMAVILERRLFRRRTRGLAERIASLKEDRHARAAGLRIDLTGCAQKNATPTLHLSFDGYPSDAAVMTALANGRLPEVEAILDGAIIARAAPMVDKRESVALGTDDVLARAITLCLSAIERLARSGQALGEAAMRPATGFAAPRFTPAYLTGALPRLALEAARRARFRAAHWRVGYRIHDGAGVAETGRLGSGWSVLPDDGQHFYADPFPYELRGERFIFVEDYPHATCKAVISVSRIDEKGRASRPEPVLEEPHHLSYPNVFAREGTIWMLPEASTSGRLTLYHCDRFPDRWTPAAVLVEGREISDATLIERDGILYMLATERDGYGSTSDTLVVFSAERLLGPWVPHPMNPITIDRRTSRPGGAVVETAGGLVIPIQDGTEGYGGGLGLSQIVALDREIVRLSEPQPIDTRGNWPYPRIHTLNRFGSLEVIDGIAAVRKGRP